MARRRENRLPEPAAIADDHAFEGFGPGGTGMNDPYLRSGIFLAPFHNHDENSTGSTITRRGSASIIPAASS
jgi:hypothetical protein